MRSTHEVLGQTWEWVCPLPAAALGAHCAGDSMLQNMILQIHSWYILVVGSSMWDEVDAYCARWLELEVDGCAR